MNETRHAKKLKNDLSFGQDGMKKSISAPIKRTDQAVLFIKPANPPKKRSKIGMHYFEIKGNAGPKILVFEVFGRLSLISSQPRS